MQDAINYVNDNFHGTVEIFVNPQEIKERIEKLESLLVKGEAIHLNALSMQIDSDSRIDELQTHSTKQQALLERMAFALMTCNEEEDFDGSGYLSFDRQEVKEALAEYRQNRKPEAIKSKPLLDSMAEIITDFIAQEIDFMTRGNLGNPELQHNIKRSRALLGEYQKFIEEEK